MSIEVRGTVKDGTIIFERPLALPDGTTVDVRIESMRSLDENAPLEVAPIIEDIASLPAFGMWKDRDDMADSVEWVNRQREAWNRYPGPVE